MRHWCLFLAFLIILGGFFCLKKGEFSLATNSWTENNQITLSTNTNWFDTSWKYRQSVGVTNTSGSTLTDYQIPIFIDTSSLISSSKIKNDCSDLRITDSVGTTLPYWIATSPSLNTCGQTSTKVWVKISSISTSGTNLYIYYGNSSASSQSNGNNIFPIFADFTIGTSLPSNWTKTDIGTSGTYGIGSSLSISNTNGEDVWNNIYGATHIYKNSKLSGSFTAEALVTSQSNVNEWAKTGIMVANSIGSTQSNGQAFVISTPGNGIAFQYQGVGLTSSAADTETHSGPPSIHSFPLFLKLKKDTNNSISGFYSANGNSWTQQGTAYAPAGVSSDQYVALFITPHNISATGNATYTFFYTRKYSGTEPSTTTPTNEQKTYASSATYTSSIFDTSYAATYGNINFGVTTPTNTSVVVKVRTSNNSGMSGATDFSSCDAVASNSDISSNNCVTDGHRYLQYQITLNSSDNLSAPVFNNISIQYSPPTFTVSFLAGSHGSISGTTPQTIEYGSSTSSISAVADSGYHFTNWSDDNTQNPRTILAVTSDKTITANFAANDINAPIISNESATASSNSAVITWDTNENSSSLVQYGLNQNYGFVTSETDTVVQVANHTVTLSNLKSCARYYYRVISSDSTSNQSSSAQKSFSTSGCAASTIVTGTETTLPTTGGTVQLVNSFSTAQLDVPSNYADEPATFQINKLSTSSAPTAPGGKSIAANNFYDLIAVTEDNQQLDTFTNPITFTISYGSDTENNFDESTLDVYKYDGSSWVKKNCSLNTINNTLACNLNGFSSYALLGNIKNNSSASTSPNSSSSSSNNSVCNDSRPVSFPDLFQINTTKNSAKIFFTPLSDTNHYFVSFSTNPVAEDYSADVTLAREGVQNFTINLLKPNTIYYLKVRGQNGCMPGEWSNIMKIKTNSQIYYKNLSPANNLSSSKIIVTQIPIKKNSESVEITPIPTQTPKSTTSQSSKKCFLWWCWLN